MKKFIFLSLFVWLSFPAFSQTKISDRKLEVLNIDFMLRGYFYAHSSLEDKDALGGFGSSDNKAKRVKSNLAFPQGKISLIVKSDEIAVFAEKYQGFKLYLVNSTAKQIKFAAQDSRLYLVQEALDMDGKWKPIEYLPSSWCGNSYHQVILLPNQYWEFAVPKFSGNLKTKLRFRLSVSESPQSKSEILSNEFEGTINKGQFVNQRPYSPNGIMDPYNN